MPTIPTGLMITQIRNQATGSQNLEDEYVVIRNYGDRTWDLAGWLVTDETDTQIRPHEYVFPKTLTTGVAWTFDPGEAIFLMTGTGSDVFIPKPSEGPSQFHFHWNRKAFVWNNAGDRVYLRHPNGTWATQPFPVPAGRL